MNGVLDLPVELREVSELLAAGLIAVQARFDRQLQSDLPPVRDLCRHVERYRGKMLRPTLTLLCGLAAAGTSGTDRSSLTAEHEMAAAVCEMVHMATLVHDDVLDEADSRRRGATVNRLRGNEMAVILGDHLIASAYHLCSQIDQRSALRVAQASAVMCSGELLQLHHRNNFSLDEPTYYEIVSRKTAALISVSCELGAVHSGADAPVIAAMAKFGRCAGVAFQIQDDILDLVGDEAVVGKTLHKDLEKGKLTLPVIHHLASASPEIRMETLRLLERIGLGEAGERSIRALASALAGTRSIEEARGAAVREVAAAKHALGVVPESPARRVLELLADAIVTRER